MQILIITQKWDLQQEYDLENIKVTNSTRKKKTEKEKLNLL